MTAKPATMGTNRRLPDAEPIVEIIPLCLAGRRTFHDRSQMPGVVRPLGRPCRARPSDNPPACRYGVGTLGSKARTNGT
jgi:hypothetical protein